MALGVLVYHPATNVARMSLWRKGYTKVKLKSGDYVPLLLLEFERIYSEWQSGKTFNLYNGLYGQRCGIKLAEVAYIMECGEHTIELEQADDDEDKKLEKSKELTGDG